MPRYRIGGRVYGTRGGAYRVTRYRGSGAFRYGPRMRYARRGLPSWGRRGRRRVRNPLRAGRGNYYRALGR